MALVVNIFSSFSKGYPSFCERPWEIRNEGSVQFIRGVSGAFFFCSCSHGAHSLGNQFAGCSGEMHPRPPELTVPVNKGWGGR